MVFILIIPDEKRNYSHYIVNFGQERHKWLIKPMPSG